jgi:hypothetical protein
MAEPLAVTVVEVQAQELLVRDGNGLVFRLPLSAVFGNVVPGDALRILALPISRDSSLSRDLLNELLGSS